MHTVKEVTKNSGRNLIEYFFFMDNYALVVKIKKNSMKILFLLLTNKEIAKTMNV